MENQVVPEPGNIDLKGVPKVPEPSQVPAATKSGWLAAGTLR